MTPHTGCDCGASVAEAISRDCKFDGLAMAWLPPHCRDDELAAEFNTVGDGPNGTWIYYSDSERTIPMDVSEVAALADEPTALVHMSVQWHTLHCIFYWRKQYRARFNGKIVEPRSDSEHHIKHCGHIFLSPGSGTKSGVALVSVSQCSIPMASWSYQPVKGEGESDELTLRILSGPSALIHNITSSTTLSTLLANWTNNLVVNGYPNSSVSVSVNGVGQFKLWLCTIHRDSPSTLEDTVDRANNFLLQNDSASESACFSLTADPSLDHGYLLSIIKLSGNHSPFSPSRPLSSIPWKIRKDLYRRTPWLLLLCLLTLLCAICIIVSTRLQLTFRTTTTTTSKNDLWLHWNTTNSIGLTNQLQFTRPWSSFLDYFSDQQQEWYTRLDDQSMLPTTLIDATELKYQKWFQDRYPEMERVRRNGDYLNSSFWEDPYAVQIPTDALFHPAHCLLAVRRYWIARETGRHVCPRDIDFHHVKHCLDSLDRVLFGDFESEREGEGGEGVVVLPQDGDSRMPWLVNACF
ncbi:hypothetical protein ASPBRDRAFT_53362 [Aspergillus brasiliensis CBS 101740]|uniref:Uncharacterized protein n=1 Tax=Aspergillus brasiliensis (strain CBS 101740 / IMI 381727 / IBT 21946) TaxID=767769 RepID=A0A1L9UNA4_ASPBC|nr:hypothetical protein ASPBRDRAFT_53362 [Aspergillus brasiliensis CBS 101740]